MNRRDATRLAIAAVDEAIGREHDAGRDGKDLQVLRAVLSSTVPAAIKATLRNVYDAEVRESVETMLAATKEVGVEVTIDG